MSDTGWFDDPSGRFRTRWYDGANWSEHVVGANGTVVADALPERDEPYPPPAPPVQAPPSAPGHAPPGSPPPGYPPPGYPPAGYAPVAYAPPVPGPFGARRRFKPGLGLAFAAVGLLLLAISLFGPSWVDGADASFLKLASNAQDSSLPDGAKAHAQIAYVYFAWAGFVLFGLTALLVLLGLVPIPPTSHSPARIVGSAVAGLAGIMHAAAFGQITSDDRTVTAYLGFAGCYVVIIGFAIGVREIGALKLTGRVPAPAPQPGLPS